VHIGDVAQNARAVTEYADSLNSIYFVVVADPEEDGANVFVLQALKERPNVAIIHMYGALGRGAAFRAGYAACSSCSIIGFLSIDGIISSRDIARLVAELRSHEYLDGIVASRRESMKAKRSKRRLASQCYSAFVNVLLRTGVADPSSPLKLFRREALSVAFDRLFLVNRAFDAELLYQARRLGMRLADYEVDWTESPLDLTPSAVITVLGAVMSIRWLHSALTRAGLVRMLLAHHLVPVKRSYRILIFCARDPLNPASGGGETYLYEQAKCWVDSGHEVTWFSQCFNDSHQSVDESGISFVRWGRAPWVFLLGALWYAVKSPRDYDFIIDCMNGVPFFSPLFSTKPKVCLVYHVHAEHFRQELPPVVSQIAVFVERHVTRWIYRTTPFITISESTRDALKSLSMTKLPVEIVYSGVPSNFAPGTKAAVPTVLYLGRLRKYKRIDKLIDAFASIKTLVPDARLIIAGDGDDRARLEILAANAGLSCVEFVGKVTEAEKIRLYQEAWAFGMPSSIEGWGIVVIEANACGTPAVAFDIGGLRDCIRSGETGFLVRTDDEFASILTRVLTDRGLRDRLSANAVTWASRFSWTATSNHMLQIIRESQPWRAVFEPLPRGEWLVTRSRHAKISSNNAALLEPSTFTSNRRA
jgi:glycosyltransferase involved in cell wall biosynthesis